MWMILTMMAVAKGRLIHVEDTNYKYYIRNTSRIPILMFCYEFDQKSNYEKIFYLLSDISFNFRHNLIFTTCNTNSSSEFLKLLQPDKLPAIFSIHMRVVYHNYNSDKFRDYGFYMEFIRYYTKNSDKVTRLPEALFETYPIPQKSQEPQEPQQAQEAPPVVNETVKGNITWVGMLYLRARNLVPENETLNDEAIWHMLISITCAPAILGMISVLIGCFILGFNKEKQKKD